MFILHYEHYGPAVASACNRKEYQEYILRGKGGRCVELTTLPPSCARCHEIWEPQPPGTLTACPGLYWDCCTLYYKEYSDPVRGPVWPRRWVEV